MKYIIIAMLAILIFAGCEDNPMSADKGDNNIGSGYYIEWEFFAGSVPGIKLEYELNIITRKEMMRFDSEEGKRVTRPITGTMKWNVKEYTNGQLSDNLMFSYRVNIYDKDGLHLYGDLYLIDRNEIHEINLKDIVL